MRALCVAMESGATVFATLGPTSIVVAWCGFPTVAFGIGAIAGVGLIVALVGLVLTRKAD